jgi:hypothetical protein
MTPMQLQYLFGLCCLQRNPDAVKITLGDLVLDCAAEKARDVDVTITLEEQPGTVRAFKAVEVKNEGKPLDVTVVEQLCAKLADMPSVTHRSIVSASGYTDGAKKKALRHDVELYSFVPWDNPISDDFPTWTNPLPPQKALRLDRSLLFWGAERVHVTVPGGPASFSLDVNAPLKTEAGLQHPKYVTFETYRQDLLLRSTGRLCQLEPAQTFLRLAPPTAERDRKLMRSPPWPQAHTLDVRDDAVFVEFEAAPLRISDVTITGHLYWESPFHATEYQILRRVGDGSVYAGAAVAPGRVEGELICFILDPTLAYGVRVIQLTETQQNLLRKVDLHLRSTSS